MPLYVLSLLIKMSYSFMLYTYASVTLFLKDCIMPFLGNNVYYKIISFYIFIIWISLNKLR